MRIGMNLLLWTAHVDETHAPLLGELAAAGFDGVEIPPRGRRGPLPRHPRSSSTAPGWPARR